MAHRFRTAFAAAALSALALPTPALADGIMDEPLPRFEDRLCPGIIGLELEYAELMVTRLRQNAEALGLRLASEGDCEANLIIAFVDDSRAWLADMVERRGYLFAEMHPAERAEMLDTDTGPFRVWHQVSPRTRDGIRVGRRDNLVSVPQAGMWQAHSRIYRPVRHDITFALVLFDRAAVEGLTLRQLADFATLQALSTEFPDEAGSSQPSLLTLFVGQEGRADELTAFDSAFLTQLYSGIPNLPAAMRLEGVEVSAADQ